MNVLGNIAALAALGLSLDVLRWVEEAPTSKEGLKRLRLVQDLARRNYRSACKDLHPDRTGNDPTRTELFKVVVELNRRIQNMKLSVDKTTYYGIWDV